MIGDRVEATTHAAVKLEVIARIIVKTRNVSVSRTRANADMPLSFNPVKCVRVRDIVAGYHTLIFKGISFPYCVNSR